jgi:uncharacterized surface protein with fasciclin (FAS1) repeats
MYLADVKNENELRDVLLYHILPGLTFVDDFTTGMIDTLEGNLVDVKVDPLIFNDVATVEESDIEACNGIINIINEILLPPGKNSFIYFSLSARSLNFHF